MAGSGSTEKTTKQKFDGFMTVLAKDEDLKALEPKDLIPRLLIEGVISDGEHEKIKNIKSKEARKTVRLSNNIFFALFELPGSPLTPKGLEIPDWSNKFPQWE